MIECKRLQQLFIYNPTTGILVRRISRGGMASGEEVGCKSKNGALIVRVDYEIHYVHRVVFAMHYGRWPNSQIDHINGIPNDNRIENLREATASQNSSNRRKSTRNTTGYKGVSFSKKTGKWRASICVKRKLIEIGAFSTPEEAHEAYAKEAKRLHGEFARLE